MNLGKALSIAAAFITVASPIAASAGTRAANALPAGKVMFEQMGARKSVAVKASKNLAGVPFGVPILIVVAGIALWVVVDKDNCRSVGAC